MVRLASTFSAYISTGARRPAGCFLHCAYAIVRGGSSTLNSSNLLEPQHHRASKVWRGLSREFGAVRLVPNLHRCS